MYILAKFGILWQCLFCVFVRQVWQAAALQTLVNIVLIVVMMWAVIYHMRNGYYI
jgi:hypothetical protein